MPSSAETLPSKPRVTLITGGSSGIGLALARKAASAGHDLILVARDRDALAAAAAELRTTTGVDVRTYAVDLAAPGGADELLTRMGSPPPRVDVLVNNAGSALFGAIYEHERESEAVMVRLQIESMMTLTQHFLSSMIAAKSGGILNVASVYSFVPVPYQAAYGASKAFLFNYSSALAEEARGLGIRVTIVAPGVTKTRFRQRAGRGADGGAMSADVVAEAAWDGLTRGALLVVPGFRNRLFLCCMGLVPMAWKARLMAAINARRGLSRGIHVGN